MSRYIKMILLGLLLASMAIFAGCGEDESSEGGFVLYATDSSYTKLIEYDFTPLGDTPEALIREFFVSMQEYSDGSAISLIPSKLSCSASSVEGDVLSIDVSGDISSITTAQRLLFTAAMTRSAKQIDGIEGLIIYNNGEIITDASGESLGILKSSRFVSNAIDEADDYRESEVTLYYANENQDGLIKVTETIRYRSSTSLEKAVVEKLIAGPESSVTEDGQTIKSTLPSGLTLLGINVRDGVCYVNFDSKFISNKVSGYDEIPVYSVVNSLFELSDISSVQISINGSTDVTMPLGTISLSSPLTYNEGIVNK